jgi:hypothetical protein
MSTSDERGRLAKDHKLTHEKLVELAKDLKTRDYSNSRIAHILRLPENVVRQMVADLTETVEDPEIKEEEIIWFPGIYGGRTLGDWDKEAGSLPQERVIELVQQRAKEDGEYAIENGLVGDNEDKMRKMMEWVRNPTNIVQCLEANPTETVDWICRDLANGSKWVANR